MHARVLSSGFFVPADSDIHVTSTKATIGLGLGVSLPDVLFTSISNHDIYDTPVGASDAGHVSSPPLLPTRRSPPQPPSFSVESEYAPMATPSPSLRGSAPFDEILDLPAPAVPTLPSSPAAEAPPTNVGLGLALACLDARELVTSVTKHDAKVGLGINLPCLDSPDLVTIIHPTLASTGLDLSILDETFEDIDISDAMSEHSSCSSPSDECVSRVDYHEAIFERAVEKPVSPTLGFDSPFWRLYASVVIDPTPKEEQVIYETS